MLNTRCKSLASKFLAAVLVCLSTCGVALAQKPAWPTKPITLINPFPAGGPTDDMSRFVANRVSAELGQPIVVSNIAGAGGSIGMQRVARSPNDGYTIGFAHVGTHVMTPLMYSKVGYDPVKDFTPIAQISDYANVLVVNANTPYRKLADLLEAARKNPGTINYASAGNGSSNHLSAEILGKMAGVSFTHIPYKGSAPALVDVLGGTVPFMFDVLSTSLPYVQSGKLRALAVTSKTRSPLLPEVPTVAETIPGYSVEGWTGIVAPAGVPADMVERLTRAIEKTMSTPEGKAYFEKRGNALNYASPANFGQLIKNDLVFWAPVIKASGAQVD
jgi:tripartite-type tricarboxylate transporter receptor subunit TctC